MGVPAEPGEAVLAAVAFAAERLLRDADWRECIGEVLGHLGEAVDVDRAYLYENVRGPDGRLWMRLRGDWAAEGVPPLSSESIGELNPYHPSFVRWLNELARGEVIRGPLDDLPEDERRILERDGTSSLILVPVHHAEGWWGFVGFDDCHDPRAWSDVEVDALRAAASTFGAALQHEREEERREYESDKFRAMVENGPTVTYIDAVDANASSLYVSPQIEELLGYTPDEWYADAELWPKLLHPDDRQLAIAENLRHNETGERFRLEYRLFHKDGHVVWVHDEAMLVRDQHGQPAYSHGAMIDVSDRKRREDEMAFLAYHDELTGLPSRAMFEELLELSLSRAQRHDGSVAVVCVDLDDFRLVNDSLGHQNGDALLRMVADRLREATRETDLVARRGGDQFLVLLADLERDAAGDADSATLRVESVAQRIQESMASAFTVSGTELYVPVSIGVSFFPRDARDAAGLVRNAEAAMYEAKKSGSRAYAVSSGIAHDSTAKLLFVTRLRKAVEGQRWVLHYQPVIDLRSGAMVGVEALIRWIEPDGTMIPPNEFIPVAEELGLIETIGDWVVHELIYQVKAWRELGIDLDVGFNLSPRQFWQPDLAERILSQIHDSGVDASRLVVEITESSAMMDPDRAQEILWRLRKGGLQIAIDDFGTGYSSLSRLREMPVGLLKIDRSFVSDVHKDPQAASIVTAFLELAHGLGMATLAEGIETEDELAFLRDRGCKLGQGFLFSKPVPPEEIISFALAGVPAVSSGGLALR
jgi:diguanylate cyclase (GGDEF)-like protein/PAS domain S-box-containing protein